MPRTTADDPIAHAFAIVLRAVDPDHPDRLAGRVEHVQSGRRQEFADARALLAWMVHERRRDELVAAHRRTRATPAGG